MLRDPSLIPLSRQHHGGLALCVLTNRALREDAGSDGVARLAGRVVSTFDTELSIHFRLEEELLFPIVPSPLVDRLIEEHREIEALVERLRRSPCREDLQTFTEKLTGHIRVEESELFEDAQKRLSREILDDLGAKLEEQLIRACRRDEST